MAGGQKRLRHRQCGFFPPDHRNQCIPDRVGKTHALVIAHRGRLVFEAYDGETTADTTLISWSMAKSITHALVGILVRDGKLEVSKTPNGENPLMTGAQPILGCDVWEHSYYIDYRNARPKYLEAFFDNLVNWDYVEGMCDGA